MGMISLGMIRGVHPQSARGRAACGARTQFKFRLESSATLTLSSFDSRSTVSTSHIAGKRRCVAEDSMMQV